MARVHACAQPAVSGVCLRRAAPFDASRGWIYHDRYQFRIPSRFIANHTNGHGNPLQVSSEAHQRRTPGRLGARIHRVLTPPVCGAERTASLAVRVG